MHIDRSRLTREEAETLTVLLQSREERKTRRQIFTMYPDKGPLRRDLYPKHMEFFRAGAQYRERGFMAANRVGKTQGGGGYELALHLTGFYPHWWEGRRFNRPIDAWAAGKTNDKVQEILQAKILGEVSFVGNRKVMDGTGLIPFEWMGKCTWRQGYSDLIDSIKIRHRLGGWSTLALKSYEMGRGAYEGNEIDVVLLDEEPPLDIFGECVIRTMSTTGRAEDEGIVMLTWTPLDGATDVVLEFLPQEHRDAD